MTGVFRLDNYCKKFLNAYWIYDKFNGFPSTYFIKIFYTNI